LAWYIHKHTENTKLAIGVFWFFLMEFLQVREPQHNIVQQQQHIAHTMFVQFKGIPILRHQRLRFVLEQIPHVPWLCSHLLSSAFAVLLCVFLYVSHRTPLYSPTSHTSSIARSRRIPSFSASTRSFCVSASSAAPCSWRATFSRRGPTVSFRLTMVTLPVSVFVSVQRCYNANVVVS
jgi:hypothetical protein